MIIRLDRLINWAKKYGFTIGMLCLAMGIGFLSVKKSMLPILMVIGVLYTIVLFTKPIWTFMGCIIILSNCFGFISDDSFSLSGAFKLRDLCLFSLFPIIFFNLVVDRKSVKQLQSPLNKYLIILLCFIVFIICYTILLYNISFFSTIRLARKYFFYSLFFIFMYYIQNTDDLKQWLKYFFIIAIIGGILFLTQFFLGPNIRILPTLLIDYQNLAGLYITRIYFKGGMALLRLCFALSFWLTITCDVKKMKYLYFIATLLFGIVSFLAFSRAGWFMQINIVLIPFFFANSKQKMAVIRLVLIASALSFCFILLVQNLSDFNILSLFSKIIQQIQSAYYDLIHQTGTFGFRLEESAYRIELFLKKPFLGVGFLHHLAAGESYKAAFVRDYLVETIDSGLITLLTTMGLGGVIVFGILSIGYIKRCINVIKNVKMPFFTGLSLGCLGYFSGGVMGFITLPFFTGVYDIPFIAIGFAIVEKVSQLHSQQT